MKRYVDRSRKEIEKWEKGDRVLLSTKDLVFKKRPTKKLDGEVCGTICNKEGNIIEYNKIAIICYD